MERKLKESSLNSGTKSRVNNLVVRFCCKMDKRVIHLGPICFTLESTLELFFSLTRPRVVPRRWVRLGNTHYLDLAGIHFFRGSPGCAGLPCPLGSSGLSPGSLGCGALFITNTHLIQICNTMELPRPGPLPGGNDLACRH